MQFIIHIRRNLFFIIISSLGGLVLSFTGIPIAWMMGSLIFAITFTALTKNWNHACNTFHPYWRQIGQTLLGIEIGRSFSTSIMDTFEDHYMVIIGMVISSIAIAFLSGLLLWRFSKANMMTSLFGTTPGGISAMPSIAEEVGANAVVVSMIQTIRILLVVSVIPFFAGYMNSSSQILIGANTNNTFNIHGGILTGLLIIAAICGAFICKLIRLPAPWLIGSMMGAASLQLAISIITQERNIAFWPNYLIIIAQILIGTSIGSRINHGTFRGLKQIIGIGLLTSLCLVLTMLACSFLIAKITHIPLVTCILAFAPGGVAEMATAAIALQADSTFVVTVQSIRLITILILLPPLFRYLNKHASIH